MVRSTIEEKAIAHDRVAEAIVKLLHNLEKYESTDLRERGVRHWRERTKLRQMDGTQVVE